MKFNTDDEWLRKRAEEEDGCCISVGGLYCDIMAMENKYRELATKALDLCPKNCTTRDCGLTIREYLKKLLTMVIVETEGFSGKRPFGNSGWTLDLYQPMVEAGLIKGKIDKDGYLEDCDENEGERIILAAIEMIFEDPT